VISRAITTQELSTRISSGDPGHPPQAAEDGGGGLGERA
jgi:hypothetical protein